MQHVFGDRLAEEEKLSSGSLAPRCEQRWCERPVRLLALCEKSQSCVGFGANSKTRALANP